METVRNIIHYENYFLEFYESLEFGAKKKVAYVLDMLKTEYRVSEKFVKYIRDGLYEMRVEYNGNIYRLFFIFDGDKIVVLFNGFQKKTQKTPEREIKQALKLKKEYLSWKQTVK